MTLLLVLMHIVPVPSSLFYWVILTFYLEDILCNISLLLNTNLEHHIQQLEIIPLSLALLLLHLLKYCDSIYCGFSCFCKHNLVSLLLPVVKRCA